MHEAVVARGVLQVGGWRAAIEPIARKVERRPRSFAEPDDVGVETPRRFEVEGANRVVIDAFYVHGFLLFDLDLAVANELAPRLRFGAHLLVEFLRRGGERHGHELPGELLLHLWAREHRAHRRMQLVDDSLWSPRGCESSLPGVR